MFEAPYILSQNNDWITGLFLVILVLLTGLRYFYPERIIHSASHFFTKNYISINFNKDKNKVFNLFQSTFFLIQLIVLSLLIYFASFQFRFNIIFFEQHPFLSMLFGLCVYFLTRYLLGYFLSVVFNLKKEFYRLVYAKMSYFHTIILWLIPLLIMHNYVENFKEIILNIILIFFFSLLLFRYSLLLYRNKKLIFSDLFYFILYLCALEIAPLIIIIKIII
jgi:hypothetical protein